MESRRDFLKVSVGAVTLAGARPLFGFQGANNRIRMGVIGMGGRAARVFDSLTRQPNCEFVVGCEVSQTKLQNFQAANRPLAQIPIVGDYRKVLDRNDVDAVLIGTPDFSHSKITVDAIAAGKDVYVEKPISNSVPRINAMLEAYNKSDRVVQVGTHQRSWDHFMEAKKIIDSGVLGPVNHVVIQQAGNYAAMKQEPVPVPPGLDWDAWQVDAPRKPFKQGYTGFRAWWEYGSGLVGDWGAHHVDVANWFMNADDKQPIKTAAVGFYARENIDPECVFDSFSISWQFDTHLMTFENSEIPRPQEDIEGWGVYFLGPNGTLQVNRMGYAVRPYVPKTQRKQGPLPIPGAGNVQGVGGAAAAQAGRGGRAGRGGGRGRGPATIPVTAKVYVNPKGGVEEDYPLDVHTKNFLDCVRSRNRKTNAPMEVGYNSALPCLIALEAMAQNRVLGWDPVARKTKPV
jgi:predicted dehydrogenase